VFKDFPASYRLLFERFSENGYARVPSMPLTTLTLRHADFDEYLQSLGKGYAQGPAAEVSQAGESCADRALDHERYRPVRG
jgi:hypothetical protein